MKTSNNTQEFINQSNETATIRDEQHRKDVGDTVLTRIDETGVLAPVRPNPGQMPRRATPSHVTNFSSETNGFGVSLAEKLNDRSLERLEAIRQQLMQDAKESFGEDLVGEALATYDHLRELQIGDEFDGESFIVTAFKEDADDTEPKDYVEPTEIVNGKKSGQTKYITRIYKDKETGAVEKTASYPVPYVHGNGILVARETGGGLLDGVEELLKDPGVTKQMFRVLTGAARVNHVGSPEGVQRRVETNLTMPIETFVDSEARGRYVAKSKASA